ncbi:hypothetical protein PG994_007258 [Apiospora phragmitis]|uniref:Uncharacterized protein n=1 Tax=Apiospora phragmitis TaxID=2905665 RepID=A0ABR1V0B3_9PEZI
MAYQTNFFQIDHDWVEMLGRLAGRHVLPVHADTMIRRNLDDGIPVNLLFVDAYFSKEALEPTHLLYMWHDIVYDKLVKVVQNELTRTHNTMPEPALSATAMPFQPAALPLSRSLAGPSAKDQTELLALLKKSGEQEENKEPSAADDGAEEEDPALQEFKKRCQEAFVRFSKD